MRMRDQVAARRIRDVLTFACWTSLALCACGGHATGGSAGTGTGGGSSSGTDGGSTHGFTPDGQVCGAPSCDTGDESKCCIGATPSSLLSQHAADCPSNVYPNKWSCDANDLCVQLSGCANDSDCGGKAAGVVGTAGRGRSEIDFRFENS